MQPSPHIGNELLLLLGVHRSRRPADREHRYGHGKELYLWGFVVAMVIFAGGGGMSLYEGITRLHESPRASAHLSWKLGVLGRRRGRRGARRSRALRAADLGAAIGRIEQAIESAPPEVGHIFVENRVPQAAILR